MPARLGDLFVGSVCGFWFWVVVIGSLWCLGLPGWLVLSLVVPFGVACLVVLVVLSWLVVMG